MVEKKGGVKKMNKNAGIYFILAVMCVLIGGHYLQFVPRDLAGFAWSLVGIGVIILIGLLVGMIRHLNKYANDEDREESEKDQIGK